MSKQIKTFEKIIDRHIISDDSFHSDSMFVKSGFLARKQKYIDWKSLSQNVRFIEGKRKLLSISLNLFGALILIFSLLYSDNEFTYGQHFLVERTSLSFITFITVLFSISKMILLMLNRRILIIQKSLSADSPLLTSKIIIIALVYLIHPNIWMNNWKIESTLSYPTVRYTRKINLILLVIQTTIVFSEFVRQVTLSGVVQETDRMVIRRNKLSNGSFRFSLKCLFLLKPFYVLFSYLLLFGIYLSLLLRLAESPIEIRSALFSWNNALWTSFVTMLTIGYGNYFPVTYLGRMVSVLTGIFGYVAFSLFVLAVSNKTGFTCNEHKTFLFLEKRKLKRKLKKKAANVIVYFCKAYLNYKRKDKEHYRLYKIRLEDELILFKDVKNKFIHRNNLHDFHRKSSFSN